MHNNNSNNDDNNNDNNNNNDNDNNNDNNNDDDIKNDSLTSDLQIRQSKQPLSYHLPKEPLAELTAHSSTVSALCIHGHSLYSSGKDTLINEWDIPSLMLTRTLQGHKRWVRSLVVIHTLLPESSLTSSSSSNNNNNNSNDNTREESSLKTDLSCPPLLSSSATRLASASWDDSVMLWDMSSATTATSPTLHLDGAHDLGINCLWHDTSSDRIYSGSDDCSVAVWDCITGVLIDRWYTDLGSIKAMTGIASTTTPTTNSSGGSSSSNNNNIVSNNYDINQGLVITGLSNGYIQLWDMTAKQVYGSIQAHTAEINALLLIPSSTTGTATATTDPSPVSSSSGSTRLFSAGNDKAIHEWNLSTLQCVRSFIGHTAYVSSIAHYSSPPLSLDDDGKGGRQSMLLSGSWDGSVRIWDLATGSLIDTLQVHNKSVNAVAVDSERKLLFTGTSDGLVKVWNISNLMINTGSTINTTGSTIVTTGSTTIPTTIPTTILLLILLPI
ncbi:hypothetical protein BASA61_003219 [Batrachochytrium salamandrivorans]|nr:hypothetical protein BASA61_003219 [Batrachochytrium salamandrivorans]